MSSALRAILGISILATIACDDAGVDPGGTGGLAPVAGSSSTSGSSTGGSPGTSGSPATGGGGAELPSGVPLTPMDGWVTGNDLMIQGAMYPYADPTTLLSVTSDFTGTKACIKGTAAKVPTTCEKPAGVTDCYGVVWGAAMGLNLNQPTVLDEMTMKMVGGKEVAYDASALTGFAFEVTSPTNMLPSALRFKVEDASGEFCTIPAESVKAGVNTYKFGDLVKECWEKDAKTMNPNAETAKSGLIKIAWAVVTDAAKENPFDFCVSNLRALK
jgi:hypothetical protein